MSLLTRKLVRDARRHWLQLAAVASTLALGVAVFGAAFDAYDDLETSYTEVYDRLRFADVTVTGGDVDSVADAVQDVDGVAALTTRAQADVAFRVPAGGGTRMLLGRVVAVPAAPAVNDLLVQEGRGPRPGDVVAATVERHMADHFDLGVGDNVEVLAPGGWQPFDITGVAVSPEYLWPARSRQDLLTSPDDFGVLFAAPEVVERLAAAATEHQVLVRYAPGADRAATERAVRAAATGTGAADVMPRRDHPSNAALQEDVDAFGEIAVLFPLLFLGAGALAAYVLLGRLVRAQRAQLGMLAANGYPRARLMRHYLAFGAVAGGGGAALGALGGLGLARWLTTAYTSSLDIPLTVTRFHPVTPVAGLAAGTIAGVAAAIGPARAATAVPPAEAMRGVAPVGVAPHSLVERLPGLRGLPVRLRMLARNAVRTPRRSVSTAVGVVLAAVLVLSSLGMLDTIEIVLDEQFGTVQREDAQLYAEAAPGDVVDAVTGVPGVAAAEPSLQAAVVLSADGHRYQTTLQGFEPATAMHDLPGGLPRSGVVLGSALREVLGVDEGDTVLVAAGDAEPVATEVAGFVDEPIGSLAYASLDEARRLAGDAGIDSVLVRYVPESDADALRARLAEVPGVVAVRDVRGTEEAVTRMLGFFYAVVGVMLLFGSVLAFVVLFNMLSVNLAERTVELATLRAAGARVRSLARLLTGENLVVVTAAIPMGLVAGWLVARSLMSSFESDLWNLSLRLRPTTPLLVAAGLVVTTLVTHLPARRNLRRLDVAEVVRERAG